MATQAIETRSNRMVVLVTDSEKRRIAENARAAKMSLSDFVRTAAEHYSEPTESERLLMKDLLAEFEKANARTDQALRRLEETATRAAEFDEAAYRARIEADLRARDDIDWTALGTLLGARN